MVPLDSGHVMIAVVVAGPVPDEVTELAVDVIVDVVVEGPSISVAPQNPRFGRPIPTEDFKKHGELSPGSHENPTQRSVTAHTSTH